MNQPPQQQQQQQQTQSQHDPTSTGSIFNFAAPQPQSTFQLSLAHANQDLVNYRGLLCFCSAPTRSLDKDALEAASSPPQDGASRCPNAHLQMHSGGSVEPQLASSLLVVEDDQLDDAFSNASSSSIDTSASSTWLPHEDDGGIISLPDADTLHTMYTTYSHGEPLTRYGHTGRCRLIILKTHTSQHPSAEVVERIKFAVLVQLQVFEAESSHTRDQVQPHLRRMQDGRIAGVISDIAGEPLKDLIAREFSLVSIASSNGISLPPSLTPTTQRSNLFVRSRIETAVRWSLLIARKLNVLHGCGLIHRNLNSTSILLNPTTGMVSFLDVTSSTRTFQGEKVMDTTQTLFAYSPYEWLYLSPEHSGKANRTIDQRSDLYSIGIIIYMLLTGHPPFDSTDVLSIVHMHLARAPPSIIPPEMTPESAPDVFWPLNILSSIAMKLLQKQGEDRYQSAAGLVYDLVALLTLMDEEKARIGSDNSISGSRNSCNGMFSPNTCTTTSTAGALVSPISLATAGAYSSFRVGEMDDSSTFRLSQRLYGRESDIASLIASYDKLDACNANGTGGRLFLIHGEAGIGKSSMVDELHKHIVRRRGLFARTKYDLMRREASCIFQAFRSLMLHLLISDPAEWRNKFLRALGSNARVITDVIPELVRIIGEQPDVLPLNPTETVKRFQRCFSQFVTVLCSATSAPLTLFLDDLQFSDSGSYSLLHFLLQHGPIRLLIIGTVRPMDDTHPMQNFIEQIRTHCADRSEEITLNPLNTNHTISFLMDSFRSSSYQSATALAQLLMLRTEGNPFYINTLLRRWYDEGLISFNFNSARWEWQLETIRMREVTSHGVGDVIYRQIKSLTHNSQQVLQYASNFGHSFDLYLLFMITGLPLTTFVNSIREIEHAGLLVIQSHGNDFVLLIERVSSDPSLSLSTVGQSAVSVTSNTPTSSPSTFTSPSISSAHTISQNPNHVAAGVLPSASSAASVPSVSSSDLSSYKLTDSFVSLLQSIHFRFSHDRIQAAAYALIPPEHLSHMHLNIVKQLLLTYDREMSEENALSMVQHINAGYDVLSKNGALVNDFQQPNTGNAAATVTAVTSGSSSACSVRSTSSNVDSTPASTLSASPPIVTSSASSIPAPHERCEWESFLFDNNLGDFDRIVELEFIAARQSKLANAYDASTKCIHAILILLQRKFEYEDLREVGFPTSNHEEEAAASSSPVVASSSVSSTMTSASALPTTQSSDFIRVSSACWSRYRTVVLRAYHELTQLLFLRSLFEQAHGCIIYLFEHMTSLAEKSQFMELHVQTLNRAARFGEALEIGLEYLRMFHVELTPTMSPELHSWLYDSINPNDDTTYASHPVFTEKEHPNPVVLTVIAAISPGLFFLRPQEAAAIPYTMLEETMRNGRSTESAYAFAFHAMMTYIDIPHAYAFGKISIMLLDRYGSAAANVSTRTRTIVTTVIKPWRDEIHENTTQLDSLLHEALHDYEWVSYLLIHLTDRPFLCNLSITRARQKAAHNRQLAVTRLLTLTVQWIDYWCDFYAFLHGFKESLATPVFEKDALGITQLCGLVPYAIGKYWSGEPLQSLESFEKAHVVFKLQMGPGFWTQTTNVFYNILALLATTPQALVKLNKRMNSVETILPRNYDASLVNERLMKADQLIALLASWDKHSETNFRNKLLLAQAERNRCAMFSHLACHQLMLLTIDLYEESIEVALANGYPIEAALAQELLGQFYTACQRTSLARNYLRQAYDAYINLDLILRARYLQSTYTSIEFGISHPSMSLASAHRYGARLESTNIGGVMNSFSESLLSHPGNSTGPRLAYKSVEEVSNSSSSTSDSITRTISSLSQMGMREQAAAPIVTASVPVYQTGSPSDPLQAVSTMSVAPFDVSKISSSSYFKTPPSSTTSNVTSSGAYATSSSSPPLPSSNASFNLLSILKSTMTFTTETNQSKLLKRLMRIVLETAAATRGVLVLKNQHQEWSVELSASVEAEEDDGTTTTAETIHRPSAVQNGGSPTVSACVDPPSGITTNGCSNNSSKTNMISQSIILTGGEPHLSAHRTMRRHSSESLASSLPINIFQYVLRTLETVQLVNPSPEWDVFSSDLYFTQKRKPKALLCLPILKGGNIFGILYLENIYHSSAFSSSHIQLLHHLCTQAALSIDNARLYTELSQHNARLEELVRERTSELEEKNTQLQIAKEEADKATKVKAEFLSNMSHEIRTPMNAVLGVSRLLTDTQLSLEQQQYVTMITNSGHLLLTIINDILDYSKIEAGELKLSMSPHNLVDCVETAVMLCYDMATSKRLYLCWYVDPMTPPQLVIDATRLQQILLNLLSNAIKFTKQGGIQLNVTTRVANSNATVTQQQQQHYGATDTLPVYQIELSVTDSGIGISAAQLSTLFRSFSQVQHINGEYGGTGLGLVISKRLAEAHGGSIRVKSALGAGSTFTADIFASQPLNPLLPLSESQSQDGVNQPHTASLTRNHQASEPQAQFPRSSTSNPLQLHGLTSSQLSQLEDARCIYIGRLDTAATNLISLMQHYRMRVQGVETLDDAITCLREMNTSNGALDNVSDTLENEREFSSRSMSPFAMIPSDFDLTMTTPSTLVSSYRAAKCSETLLVVDLDSPGIQEESVREQLATVALSPMRLLLLYSKPHSAIPIVDMIDRTKTSLWSVSSAPTYQPVFANAAQQHHQSPSLNRDRAVNSPPSPTHRGMMQQSTPPLSASSQLTSATVSPTPGRLNGGMNGGPSVAIGSTPVCRRQLRKPFKMHTFLTACVAVLLDTPAIPSQRHLRMNGTSECTPGQSSVTPSILHTTLIEQATNHQRLVSDAHAILALAEHSTELSAEIVPLLATSTASHGSSTRVTGATAAASTAASSQSSKKAKITNLAHAYPLRILLAEDNLINQKLMTMIMRKLGYEILIASNGSEVLDILEREAKRGKECEIQCILMDASMDVMDGIECTRFIRSQQLPHRVRPFIIAQTANVTDAHRSACLSDGLMDLFLPKPIDIDQLQRCLKTACQVHQNAQTQGK